MALVRYSLFLVLLLRISVLWCTCSVSKSAQGAAHFVRDKIMEVNALAADLFEAGRLDAATVSIFDTTLIELEKQVLRLGEVSRHELRFMIGILRGTLHQQASGMSDVQVEEVGGMTFSNAKAWDEYYKTAPTAMTYDWYGSWDTPLAETSFRIRGVGSPLMASTLGELISLYLTAASQILVLGCGSSDLSEKLYSSGFENIVNIDISEALIEDHKIRLSGRLPRMQWLRMDAAALSFEASSFDAIVDKGTLDAIEQNKSLHSAAVLEAYRALRPGGIFLTVTGSRDAARIKTKLQSARPWTFCDMHHIEPLDSNGISSHIIACERGSAGNIWKRLQEFFWPKGPAGEL